MELVYILQALWIVLPVYLANALAVIVGGGKPIDGGRTFKDGKRLLGDGKTWRGLFFGTFLGMTGGFGLTVAARTINASALGAVNLNLFLGAPWNIIILFSLCFGGLLGDIVESFFKRRIGKNRGDNWFVFDQLDFIIGALAFSFLISILIQPFTKINWFLESLTIWHILIILLLTPLLHVITNLVFRKTKQKATEPQN